MLKSDKLKLYLTASIFAVSVFWSGAGSAQDAVGTLTGVIKDASGAPVAGAFVQMKNAERRLNFMVITHAEGKYTDNRLPAGKYVVQAIGGEQQSAPVGPGRGGGRQVRVRGSRPHAGARTGAAAGLAGTAARAFVARRPTRPTAPPPACPTAPARPSSRRNAISAMTRSGSCARAARRPVGSRSSTP